MTCPRCQGFCIESTERDSLECAEVEYWRCVQCGYREYLSSEEERKSIEIANG